jgi:hypothetical protein
MTEDPLRQHAEPPSLAARLFAAPEPAPAPVPEPQPEPAPSGPQIPAGPMGTAPTGDLLRDALRRINRR